MWRDYLYLFAAFVCWSVLSLFWSSAVRYSANQSGVVFGTFAGGLMLVGAIQQINLRDRDALLRSVVIGVVAGIALLAEEVFSPVYISRVFSAIQHGTKIGISVEQTEFVKDNLRTYYIITYGHYYKVGTAVAALMVWPALAALSRRGFLGRWGAVALFAATAFVLAKSGAGASQLALAAGTVAAAASYLLRRYAVPFFASALVLAVAAMPLLPTLLPEPAVVEARYPRLPDSVYPRIFIWQTAAHHIAKSPWLGMGMNTARTISTSKDKVAFSVVAGSTSPRTSEPMPLHPHNAVLQVWLELGAVGAAIMAGLLVVIVRAIGSVDDAVWRALTLAALAAGFTVAAVSYSIWSSWWQGTLWLTAAFVLAAAPAPRRPGDAAGEVTPSPS